MSIRPRVFDRFELNVTVALHCQLLGFYPGVCGSAILHTVQPTRFSSGLVGKESCACARAGAPQLGAAPGIIEDPENRD